MDKLELIAPLWPAPAKVFAATTTRRGGSSSGPYASFNLADHVGDGPEQVQYNRQRLAQSLGFPAQFQWLRQVHGARPVVIAEPGPALEADSLITRTPGLALCVLTADCLPVFISSRNGDEIAIIHAGWRGLSAGIIENTLAAMKTAPRELLAWLGPAILACHYEVGEDVREAFISRAITIQESDQIAATFTPGPEAGKFHADSPRIATTFTPGPEPGKYHADLPKIATIKLRALGVPAIDGGTRCTYRDSNLFYSHRRDGPCGRMASVICIRYSR